jgi:hypothetical protein
MARNSRIRKLPHLRKVRKSIKKISPQFADFRNLFLDRPHLIFTKKDQATHLLHVLVISSLCLNLPLLAAHKAGEVLSCVGNGRHLVATCQQVHEFQLVQPQFWDTQLLSSSKKIWEFFDVCVVDPGFSRHEIWIRPL